METLKNLGRASLDRSSLEQKRSSSKPSMRSGNKLALPTRLEMDIESPPLVFYGPASSSTGALLSGLLGLVVVEEEIRIKTFDMVLRASVTTRKPVSNHCAECSTKISELSKWAFVSSPMILKKGKHEFPFSFLLPGRLPASSHGVLANIEYTLAAKATTKSSAEPITFERNIQVSRAVMPGGEKNSVRIFPPTSLAVHLTLPSVIHPIGEFPIYFRLDGCVTKSDGSMTRWRLRKFLWHIEEISKMISPACPKHAHKIGGEGKGVLHNDTRKIGSDEYKNGWKTDFESGNGQIEMEFKACIRSGKNPVCDVESPTGMNVSHNLAVELVVIQEYCPNKKNPKLSTPTGVARILRMNYALIVTERGGMGISWDEEQPPMYSDVPASPPGYIQMQDYDGPPLDHEDLENLHLHN